MYTAFTELESGGWKEKYIMEETTNTVVTSFVDKAAEAAGDMAISIVKTAAYLVGSYALTRLMGRAVDSAFKAYDDSKKGEEAKA